MPKIDLRTIEKRVAKLEGGHKPPIQRVVVKFGIAEDSEKISFLVKQQAPARKNYLAR